MIDLLFTKDYGLTLSVHYFVDKNAHRLSATTTTDGPRGTSHLRVFATGNCMLNKAQVFSAFL